MRGDDERFVVWNMHDGNAGVVEGNIQKTLAVMIQTLLLYGYAVDRSSHSVKY